ncbi:unnamed protein product [Protopolystoma xenopodis]|uniref:CUB domain-containing protein n=1 Tax=Protopolystoma xenopodis TaxID=117903 RepID=A0A448WAL3_9PLAT|nr:unnamed protein product [Protopolystoma xenopodis]
MLIFYDTIRCPSDFLAFFDGSEIGDSLTNPTAPMIGGRFCGQSSDLRGENLRIVSTGSVLTMIFVTGASTDMQTGRPVAGALLLSPSETKDLLTAKGFRIKYSFTNLLVEVPESLKHLHLRGTECDFLIRSQGRSFGEIISPKLNENSSKFVLERICSVYFLGLHHKQMMEVVRIGFENISLPAGDAKSGKCSNGFLAVYGGYRLTSFQDDSNFLEMDKLPDMEENSADENVAQLMRVPSQVWCDVGGRVNSLLVGRNLHLSPLLSQRSLLMIRFNSTGMDPSTGFTGGFKLFYKFTIGE